MAAEHRSAGPVRDALGRLQSATREVLASVKSLPGSRPVDVAAGLGVDLKLAWRVARIAQSSDPFECVRHLPGAQGWQKWLDAAAALGARSATVAAARRLFDEVHELGVEWAGSRPAFAAFAAGAARNADTRVALEQRREFTRAAAFMWGMRAELALRTDVLAPGKDGRTIDCATVRGFVGLERLRPDAEWHLEAPVVIDDAGSRRRSFGPERLDPLDRTREPPFLLREFSSDPLPPLRPQTNDGGRRTLELGDGDVGPRASMTLVHGAIVRDMQPIHVSARHHGIFQKLRLRTPVERLVFDLVVHRDLVDDVELPEAIAYCDLWRNAESPQAHGPRSRLPFVASVDALKSSPSRARLEGFARYQDLMDRVFARTGWKPAEFQSFRASIEYPPVPSSLVLELPVRSVDEDRR